MLKINNNFKKHGIPLITMAVVVSGIFLFQYLTFTPEYSSAESISTTDPVKLPEIEGTITTKFGTEGQGYKTYMQEIDLNYCQSLPNETTGQLVDGRDGKIYWVTVLGSDTDGTKTCWMTQDLDLDIDKVTFTTDNTGNNLYKGSDTAWDGGKSANNDKPITSKDPSITKWPTTNGNPTQNIDWYERNKTHGTEYASLGNLYSFEAATAGTGHLVTNDGGDVLGSICPAGWKLPLGGNSTNAARGSFQSLRAVGMNNTTAAINFPYYFQYGGWIDGLLYGVGASGRYWSATSLSSVRAYYFYFNTNGNFAIATNDYRYFGYSVRCVMRDASYTPPVISSSTLANPNISVTVDKILTMEIADKEVNIEPKTNEVMTGSFTATVSSNAGYDIGLSAAENSPISLVNKKDDIAVAEIPASNNIQVGTNGWGIKCVDDENCILKSYNALTLYNNPQVYFSSTNAVANKPTHFEVGIGISSSLPSGTYSTNILVTASQK